MTPRELEVTAIFLDIVGGNGIPLLSRRLSPVRDVGTTNTWLLSVSFPPTRRWQYEDLCAHQIGQGCERPPTQVS